MLTQAGHLTYCTNIHPGESWADHFSAIREHFPSVKKSLSPQSPMGIGLRLSNEASMDLIHKENLSAFKEWLRKEDAYVFTMNGFPYGGFHGTIVKDKVHVPDWTSAERGEYSLRLFHLLTALLPADMDGGVSTSPLGYRLWYDTAQMEEDARETATRNVVSVVEQLIHIHRSTGKLLHLDIEPEPDGMLQTGTDFLDWFENDLLRLGIPFLREKLKISGQHAEDLLKNHLRLCYDVCHFAIGYEPHAKVIGELMSRGIRIGKIQISSALKCDLKETERKTVKQQFENFNEPVYLHQVIARTEDGRMLRYPDLPEALVDVDNRRVKEWRAHFHVPLFTKSYGSLYSTQDEIGEVLQVQKDRPFTAHLEVETYTWDVLPSALKLPLTDSIIRELLWVKQFIEK